MEDAARRRPHYTEREKELLSQNKIVILPCFDHPLLHIGESEEIRAGETSAKGIPARWQHITKVLSRKLAVPEDLCRGLLHNNSLIESIH